MRYRKLVTATKSGSRLEQLKILAEILARQIDSPGEKDNVASLARQYRETVREIEEIEGMDSSDDDISRILSEANADGEPRAVR